MLCARTADGAGGVAMLAGEPGIGKTRLAREAAGRANPEMAADLDVSVHTIERHVANIFAKIGARNRAEATAWAHRSGLAV
jgi:DNA-binding CsgD family transcriptional regulator